MEINILKRVITDQRSEIEKTFREQDIIGREDTAYLTKFLKHPNILVILGVRRGGKSIFSLLLSKQFKESVAHLNFDDERLVGLKTGDLDNILQAFYELYGEVPLIILDEIQNVPGWELFVNRLRRTKKVIITGSNSKLLSGELATHLTGRYIDFTLYPFSFGETLDSRPDIYLTKDRAGIRRQLDEYLRGSGFPEFRRFGSSIVVRTYGDIISKDCIRRHDIREEETFRELARYLISNFSGEFTYSKLLKIFGLKDPHTVKNYVSYIQEAFLIAVLERFSPKLKQQAIAPKKVYAIDQGFCNFIGFRLSEDRGRILENVVCIELLRKKARNHGMELYYWKDHQQNEVDFVIKKGRKVAQLIQVCYDISDPTTKEREIKALLKASEELGCRDLLVITSEKEGEETIDGKRITYVPLWRYLLQGTAEG